MQENKEKKFFGKAEDWDYIYKPQHAWEPKKKPIITEENPFVNLGILEDRR